MKVKKLVHVSSIAALGRKRPLFKKDESNAELITESMQWEPVSSNNYGKSKYLGELEVWRGIAEGLNAVIVNPSLILGAGDWNNSSTAIFKKAYNEFPWYAEGETGFVDVQDVVKAMIMLMQSDVTAQRFIISAQNESFRTIFSMIAKEFKKKLPSKKVTPFLAGLVWRLEALKALFTGSIPLITKETSITALTVSNFDNNKFKKHFPGFAYKKIEITIREVCKVLQQKVNKQ